MSTVPKYPLPYSPADDRLDEDLVGLVADLIAFRTGYADIDDGPDLERLRQALRWFLYATPDDGGFAERFLEEQQAALRDEDARTGEVLDTHDAGAGIRCSCGDAPDPNCPVHASRFRRPCDDPAPHGEHRWVSPTVLGSTTWTCPGVEGGAR